MRLNSLGTRLAALLSLAILPLGLIVVIQTWRVIDEAAQKTDTALMGQTLRAARPERGAIQEAIGAAEALGVAVALLRDQPIDLCRSLMASFVARDPVVRFAGYVPLSGIMECASEGAPVDFTPSVSFAGDMAEPRRIVRVTEAGKVTGAPSILTSSPVFAPSGDMIGYVTLSVVLDPILNSLADEGPSRPLDVITFNSDGEVLTSGRGVDTVERRLPVNRALRAFAGGGPVVFRDVDSADRWRIFTITPLIENVVYAMAIWPRDVAVGPLGLWRWTVPTIVLPILMWATSLVVAFVAVHQLVIRHIRRLRKRMRLFSRFRRVEDEREDEDLPSELREVTNSFVMMAHTILRDEAEQEDSLREKDALLREIYHRVRNNLQLIASINNMQIRALRSEEAKHVLRRLQDRIMALATIHGALYEANTLSKVRADTLVAELATQITLKARDTDPSVEIETVTVPVMLHPDQAVPLALLVVEALTNAVKHLRRPAGGGAPRVVVTLAEEGDGSIRLVVENTIGRGDVVDLTDRAHGGLGLQLINAFVTQLGGEKRVRQTDDAYRLEVHFSATHYGDEAAIA